MDIITGIIAVPLAILVISWWLKFMLLPGWRPHVDPRYHRREEPLPTEPASEEDRTCRAGHIHRDLVETFLCPQSRALRDTEDAIKRAGGEPPAICPTCHRNHFAGKCPE